MSRARADHASRLHASVPLQGAPAYSHPSTTAPINGLPRKRSLVDAEFDPVLRSKDRAYVYEEEATNRILLSKIMKEHGDNIMSLRADFRKREAQLDKLCDLQRKVADETRLDLAKEINRRRQAELRLAAMQAEMDQLKDDLVMLSGRSDYAGGAGRIRRHGQSANA